MGLTKDQIKDLPALAVLAKADLLNGILLSTERLTSISTTSGSGNNYGFFEVVVADQDMQVGAMVFKITRSGSTSWAGVGIYKLDGTLLAYGNAQGFLGQEGWKRVPLTAPITLQAGKSYVLGIGQGGDNIPAWAASETRTDINVFITQPPYRSFRKSLGTMNQNIDFGLSTVNANTDPRIFLGLVAS